MGNFTLVAQDIAVTISFPTLGKKANMRLEIKVIFLSTGTVIAQFDTILALSLSLPLSPPLFVHLSLHPSLSLPSFLSFSLLFSLNYGPVCYTISLLG